MQWNTVFSPDRLHLFTQSMPGRKSQAKGFTGEQVALCALRTIDSLHMIEPIYMGWKPFKWINKQRRIALVYPQAKLTGDFRAVGPNGLSVLIEVKVRDRKLLWSSFQEHQRKALSKHAQLGGISLIVWVEEDIYVLRWPMPAEHFKKGKALTVEAAQQLDLKYATHETMSNLGMTTAELAAIVT